MNTELDVFLAPNRPPYKTWRGRASDLILAVMPDTIEQLDLSARRVLGGCRRGLTVSEAVRPGLKTMKFPLDMAEFHGISGIAHA
jgi:hypothetical protein